MSRSCKTCKYYDPANMLVRCILCRPEMKDWEPKDRDQAARCESCRHEEKSAFREPCISCGVAWPGSSSHWEPKEDDMENEVIKRCGTCKYETLFANEVPCVSCTNAWSSGDACNWEPKEQEENMENENTTTATIDTEAELRKLREELEQANRKTCRLENEAHSRELILAEKMGMIEGLKFAIRCNGVSGGEV